MHKRNIRAELGALEAMLFASGEVLSLKEMAKALSLPEGKTRALAAALQKTYEEKNSGICVTRTEDRYRMSTRPVYYEFVRGLYEVHKEIKLTEAQLEVLAIAAYEQPLTRQRISDVRGVASDAVISRLMTLGLLEEAGRLKMPGRPVLLRTTDEFLRVFGLSSKKELPEFPKEGEA